MLETTDLKNGVYFANWGLVKTEEEPDFLSVLWTGEANVSRCAQDNVRNACTCSDINAHWLVHSRHQNQLLLLC